MGHGQDPLPPLAPLHGLPLHRRAGRGQPRANLAPPPGDLGRQRAGRQRRDPVRCVFPRSAYIGRLLVAGPHLLSFGALVAPLGVRYVVWPRPSTGRATAGSATSATSALSTTAPRSRPGPTWPTAASANGWPAPRPSRASGAGTSGARRLSAATSRRPISADWRTWRYSYGSSGATRGCRPGRSRRHRVVLRRQCPPRRASHEPQRAKPDPDLDSLMEELRPTINDATRALRCRG